MAIDRHGRAWVLDWATSRIHCFSARNGELVATVGPTISGLAQYPMNPFGLAFTTAGHLAISDTGNNRLLICRIMYGDND